MFRLRSDQQVAATCAFADSKGNATTAENVQLESSDPAVVAVTDNGDGSFLLVAGQVGTAQINFSADARLGEGEKLITGSETIEVVPGEATDLKLSFGEPVEQPVTAPTGADSGEGGEETEA